MQPRNRASFPDCLSPFHNVLRHSVMLHLQKKDGREPGALIGMRPHDPKRVVDLLVGGLIKIDPAKALKYQDVFRALALLRSHDPAALGIVHSWLQGYDADEAMRKNF